MLLYGYTMKLLSCLRAFAIATLPALASQAAIASDVPPPSSKPLSSILASAQTVITKAEFDDGLWEVKGCTNDVCEKLYINPQSGEVTRRKTLKRVEQPAAQARPTAQELVKRIEAAEVGTIIEIDFDKGAWKVELVKALDAS